ncbi:MAG: hypothetical protein ACRD2L_01800 [Terriglobia bacterium]
MGSIRRVYDAEGDILDVDFRLTGQKPQRGIELHDNVTVWGDAQGTRILHLTLLSYSTLLGQPSLSLTGLKKLPTQERTSLLKLLKSKPIKRFLVCLDEKKVRFRVTEPGVREAASA